MMLDSQLTNYLIDSFVGAPKYRRLRALFITYPFFSAPLPCYSDFDHGGHRRTNSKELQQLRQIIYITPPLLSMQASLLLQSIMSITRMEW